MRKVVKKVDQMLIAARGKVLQKKPAVDQIIIMFIIIAVAAGIAGLLYIFGTKTLLLFYTTIILSLNLFRCMVLILTWYCSPP